MVPAAPDAWPSLALRGNLEPRLCKPSLRFPGNANFRARDKTAKPPPRPLPATRRDFRHARKPANCGHLSSVLGNLRSRGSAWWSSHCIVAAWHREQWSAIKMILACMSSAAAPTVSAHAEARRRNHAQVPSVVGPVGKLILLRSQAARSIALQQLVTKHS